MHLGMSLISAFGLGALHALEPGHGKGIMGTYLVLSRGRAIDAVILGLLPATTHTLVVVILAVTASSTTWLAAAAAGLPRQEFSIWLQFVSGLLVVIIGLRMLLSRSGSCCDHFCKRSTLQLAKLPGINRDTGGLLLVGISNGLVPCPGALAIMLLSIGSGTPATGLALVVAFGVGGALALVTVGLLFVKLSSLTQRMLGRRSWRWLTAASGLLIIFIGILTAWTALERR